MIVVKVVNQADLIQSLEVKGHAQSAKHGQDLICAGVSCIVTGLANAIDQLCGDVAEITLNEGFSEIIVKEQSERLQIVLNTGLIQLRMMAEQYPQYLKIK